MTAAPVIPLRPSPDPSRVAAPPLGPARALAVRAFWALIQHTLDGSHHMGRAAGRLIGDIAESDFGTVTADGDRLRLSLYGIHAEAQADTVALLRAWQDAAGTRLAREVRP